MPGQAVRMKTVRMKLNTIRSEFRGKNVLLVDDSIVRGTTSRELVTMAREAGARKVYVTSAAPPVRWPNVYGIDIPTKTELIAYERDEAQVGGWWGWWLMYDWFVFSVAAGLRLSQSSIQTTTTDTTKTTNQNKTEPTPQVAAELGADWVVYQELDALKESITRVNPAIPDFDGRCVGVGVGVGVGVAFL